jgi:N-acetylneuraminic acid mutarotase
MKKSLLLLISICSLCLLNGCGGGSSSPPPLTPDVATHFSVTAPATVTTGAAFNLTVTALDASNSVATNYSGTVHFTSTDSQAVLPANSTLTNGTGTFSATLKTAVGQTITSTDTVAVSITGTSNSINVTGPPATHFSVTAPATATSGTAFNFTVTPLDASNNVATSYSGTVHFTSTDGQAVLPANSALANGTATVYATLNTVAIQSITATDTVTSSITGTSNSINVIPLGKLAITSGQPPNGTVGANYGEVYSICNGSISYFFELGASGGIAGRSGNGYGWFGSSLPPGLQVHSITLGIPPVCPGGSLWVIDGVPTAAGTFIASISVRDSESPPATASAQYTIIINPRSPVINLTPAPSAGAVNLPYSFTFTATGGQPPLTWSETGALPPGLGPLSNGGVLSGTPTEVGSFPITVMAQDSLGQNSAPQDFTISVFLHGFKATGSMGTARTSHTATLLSDGKVLVTGGSAGGPPRDGPPGPPTLLATAELFDPTSGTFTGTGSMSIIRIGHTATLLNNGKVLVTGGSAGELTGNGPPTPDTLAEAELFDPTSGTFTPTKGNMETGRVYHTATSLNDGTVLVTGGVDSNNAVEASAELFDPTSGTFTPTTGKMSVARYGHTATLLNNGKVLITGGGGNTAELFDPTSETFTPTTGSMETARSYHTATLLDDGKVLVTGGVDNNNQAVASAELYDPTSETFTPTTGTMETPRGGHTATLLSDGTVLVAGGNDANNNSLATAELFDPASGTFTGTGSMETARAGHTGTLLKDGTVLVTGGLNNYGSVLAEAELY